MDQFESYYRSTVYYMERNPRWMEMIKLKIPVEEFKKCHLLFTYRHRSATQTKDKLEREFAFSFLPLKNIKGTIQDDEYKLIVYKVSGNIEAKNYLTLPAVHGAINETDMQRVDGIQYTKVSSQSNFG